MKNHKYFLNNKDIEMNKEKKLFIIRCKKDLLSYSRAIFFSLLMKNYVLNKGKNLGIFTFNAVCTRSLRSLLHTTALKAKS